QAAKQWHARGKPRDLVWRGATAQEALGYVRRRVLDLSAVEHEFVVAIMRRRIRASIALLAAVSVIVAGVGFAFFRITQAEREARSNLDTAKQALGEANAAKADLNDKLDKLQKETRARESAEKRGDEIQNRLDQTQQLSRQELEAANQELQKQVREA